MPRTCPGTGEAPRDPTDLSALQLSVYGSTTTVNLCVMPSALHSTTVVLAFFDFTLLLSWFLPIPPVMVQDEGKAFRG